MRFCHKVLLEAFFSHFWYTTIYVNASFASCVVSKGMYWVEEENFLFFAFFSGFVERDSMETQHTAPPARPGVFGNRMGIHLAEKRHAKPANPSSSTVNQAARDDVQ